LKEAFAENGARFGGHAGATPIGRGWRGILQTPKDWRVELEALEDLLPQGQRRTPCMSTRLKPDAIAMTVMPPDGHLIYVLLGNDRVALLFGDSPGDMVGHGLGGADHRTGE
jgi:hypothetical protein